jgi:hypothetical protein
VDSGALVPTAAVDVDRIGHVGLEITDAQASARFHLYQLCSLQSKARWPLLAVVAQK